MELILKPTVKPCTKEIQYAEASNNKGNKIIFYDLLGIGEADEKYLNEYVKKIIESDVVLWTHHADNRSVKFDLDAQKK